MLSPRTIVSIDRSDAAGATVSEAPVVFECTVPGARAVVVYRYPSGSPRGALLTAEGGRVSRCGGGAAFCFRVESPRTSAFVLFAPSAAAPDDPGAFSPEPSPQGPSALTPGVVIAVIAGGGAVAVAVALTAYAYWSAVALCRGGDVSEGPSTAGGGGGYLSPPCPPPPPSSPSNV